MFVHQIHITHCQLPSHTYGKTFYASYFKVAQISIGAASLEGDVEMSDERIYESLGVTTALPTTTVEVTTSSAVLAQGLPLYMLCQMTALLLLLNTRN